MMMMPSYDERPCHDASGYRHYDADEAGEPGVLSGARRPALRRVLYDRGSQARVVLPTARWALPAALLGMAMYFAMTPAGKKGS